jgi:hypothetical protein
VPQRTNTFQQVVAILHQHLADDSASVEESAFLVNRVTGKPREVDVVIRSTVAGQEMIVGVEATMKRGDSPWVEGIIGKHADLPTDRLVLVAERGFSRPARVYAKRKGVALIEPADLAGDDPARRLAAEFHRVWPKGVSMTPDSCRMLVRKPDGTSLRVKDMAMDTNVYGASESYLMTVAELFAKEFEDRFLDACEQMGLQEITEDLDRFFIFRIGEPGAALRRRERGRLGPLSLRWEQSSPPEFHVIEVADFRGRAIINVSQFDFTFRRFGEHLVGHAAGCFAGREALMVLTETEQGRLMSLQLGEHREQSTDAAAEGYA